MKGKYKETWNQADFEEMSWHDCKIYSILPDNSSYRLILDIDYIFEWVTDPESEYYKFLISPSTLVFHNVWDIKIDLETDGEIEITDVYRENPQAAKNEEYVNKKIEWDWSIETLGGVISFKSTGLYKIPGFTLAEPEIKLVRPARPDELPRQ